MKTLLLGACVAALLGSAAFAGSRDTANGAGNAFDMSARELAMAPHARKARPHNNGLHARAYAAPAQAASGTVYVEGKIVGADPDPNVRLQLLRDPPTIVP